MSLGFARASLLGAPMRTMRKCELLDTSEKSSWEFTYLTYLCFPHLLAFLGCVLPFPVYLARLVEYVWTDLGSMTFLCYRQQYLTKP